MTTQTDRIEKETVLRAPRSKVWRALTDARQFGAWFRATLEGEFVLGQWTRGRITYPGYEHLSFEAKVEVLTAQGKPVAEAVRTIAISEPSYYRWRAEYGGLKLDQVKGLKQLEAENARLRKAVADLTLEKLVLKEAASGNF